MPKRTGSRKPDAEKSRINWGIIAAILAFAALIVTIVMAAVPQISQMEIDDAVKKVVGAAQTQIGTDIKGHPEHFKGGTGSPGKTGPPGPPGSLPIGSIIAWHKNPAAKYVDRKYIPGPALDLNPDSNTELPDGWMECNGDPLSPDTELYKLTGAMHVPNLNNTSKPRLTDYEGGMFLRGGTQSGKLQEATRIFSAENSDAHALEDNVREHDAEFRVRAPGRSGGVGPEFNSAIPFRAVRPVNMSVIWIIRVK